MVKDLSDPLPIAQLMGAETAKEREWSGVILATDARDLV